MTLPILVIKFGTGSITLPDGTPDEGVIQAIAQQVAALSQQYRIILVSSGGCGCWKTAF